MGCKIDNLATHLCQCGFLGSQRCRCTPDMVRRYRDKISGPLLDRIDLQVQVLAIPGEHIVNGEGGGESSTAVRTRVIHARQIQLRRQGKTNGTLSTEEIKKYCALGAGEQSFMATAIERLGLSARAYHRVLKVARTIADLNESTRVEKPHITEALGYRFQNQPER